MRGSDDPPLPLPRNHVLGTEALLELRTALVTEDPGPSTALTALREMVGIGKTILAQGLSYDPVVQEAIPVQEVRRGPSPGPPPAQTWTEAKRTELAVGTFDAH